MLMSPSTAVIGQYFNKKRGTAMGIGVAGSSLGGIIFPIVLQELIQNPAVGFGWAVRISGFLMAILLSVSAIAIRPRLPPRKDQFFLWSAFKKPAYVFTIAAAFLMTWGLFTPFFFLPSYAVSKGMSIRLSSYLLSILNGASLPGRVIPGILADKFGRLNMLFVSGISTGILLLCWPGITTNAPIIVFAALYGYCSGSIISLIPATVAISVPSARDIGTYLGMCMTVLSLSGLTGSPINGALLTHYGFISAMIFSGVMVLIGAFLVLIAKAFTRQGLRGIV
jgi:MFS family permease